MLLLFRALYLYNKTTHSGWLYRRIISVAIISYGIGPALANAETPSHVYQEARYIIADLEAIRAKKNITEPVRVPGIQIAKTPIHVYTKGLELYKKISIYKNTESNSGLRVPAVPKEQVTPAQVLVLLQEIHQHTTQIRQQLNIDPQAEGIPWVPGKTPSDVYEYVWQASYLMDGLVPPIKPEAVFENTLAITNALVGLAQALNTPITLPEKALFTDKNPIDANIEGFKVLFLLVDLERKLQIKPSRIPGFPAGTITPSDVYDTTNNILAELARIRISYPFEDAEAVTRLSATITPNDVVSQMKIIQHLLELLTA